MTELHDTPTNAGPSRRNVAKVTAWTVPAVAVAVATPAAAASPVPTYDLVVNGVCPLVAIPFITPAAHFTVTSNGAATPAGRTLTLTYSSLLSVGSQPFTGSGVQFLSIAGTRSVTATLPAIAHNGSVTIGLGSSFVTVLGTYSATVNGIDANTSNNSDQFTIVAQAAGLGICL